MTDINVVPIGTPNLKDVPASLRRLADYFESGQPPNVVHAIVVAIDEDGDLACYGYGEVGTTANEVGILFAAATKMILGT